jgi:hypothetical protein
LPAQIRIHKLFCPVRSDIQLLKAFVIDISAVFFTSASISLYLCAADKKQRFIAFNESSINENQSVMKSTVAIYPTHREAFTAINLLENEQYPLERVSVIGNVEIIEDHLKVKFRNTYENLPLIIGSILGVILGMLMGKGILYIPGLPQLYHAGLVIGTLAGFGMGTFIGGVVTLIVTARAKSRRFLDHQKHLSEGKFLVVVEGTLSEIEKAERILHTEGTHLKFNAH